ncbi:hypothetical protein Scep_027719 [Stephania cephalantha]|uniref:Uncharacterized protein n=1 Tax=Stephania cephalantha TaxID=152367 RepID=A0AAP0ED41_9MAGN
MVVVVLELSLEHVVQLDSLSIGDFLVGGENDAGVACFDWLNAASGRGRTNGNSTRGSCEWENLDSILMHRIGSLCGYASRGCCFISSGPLCSACLKANQKVAEPTIGMTYT